MRREQYHFAQLTRSGEGNCQAVIMLVETREPTKGAWYELVSTP